MSEVLLVDCLSSVLVQNFCFKKTDRNITCLTLHFVATIVFLHLVFDLHSTNVIQIISVESLNMVAFVISSATKLYLRKYLLSGPKNANHDKQKEPSTN